jgi:hypothetical protein
MGALLDLSMYGIIYTDEVNFTKDEKLAASIFWV